MKIYKYDLGYTVLLPNGAKILKWAAQDDVIRFWALVDPAQCLVTRHFRIVGTESNVPDGIYLDSVFMDSFVWHIFEVAK